MKAADFYFNRHFYENLKIIIIYNIDDKKIGNLIKVNTEFIKITIFIDK